MPTRSNIKVMTPFGGDDDDDDLARAPSAINQSNPTVEAVPKLTPFLLKHSFFGADNTVDVLLNNMNVECDQVLEISGTASTLIIVDLPIKGWRDIILRYLAMRIFHTDVAGIHA